MVKILSSGQFDLEWARYIFDPQGGKHNQGSFVLTEKDLSHPRLNPPIVLVYGASEVFSSYLKNKRDFKLILNADGKPIGKPLTGVISEHNPNEDYYEKVGQMLDRAKKYYKENYSGRNSDDES